MYSCPEPLDKPIARAAKSKTTSLAQQRVNQTNSKVKLAMLIGGNFGPGDLFVTFTFAPEHLPATYAEFQKKVRKFHDLLRAVRRKQGKDARYIYAAHHGEKIRWHLHALVSTAGPDDWETIKSLWPWGDVHIKHIQDTTYSTPDAMAAYLIGGWADRPNSARSWCASTNLAKIVVTTYREHDPNARLELPADCEMVEADSWTTQYGSYEFISFFRRCITVDNFDEPGDLQPDSRELIDCGIL